MGPGVPHAPGGEGLRLVFDTRSLLKLLFDEPGGREVESLVLAVDAGRSEGFVSAVTITELWYLIARRDETEAENAIATVLGSLDLVHMELTISRLAGRFKAAKRIPIADAIIAATASALGAVVVTDDPDFQGLGVDVETESDLAQRVGKKP